MSKVLLENVGKTFDGKKMVLNDFSLQIDDGDFVVLIGPSGCGKTTILNIIAGLECPTTGNVYIDDALSNSVEPKDRDVAMVFQNHALYPHLSVYKNLAFPLKLRKYSKKDIEKEVFFIANLLNIAELLNRKPNQLSGGQQQRVAIGKALIRNPSLFLMDEPLSSLDAELKILLRTEIKELHSKLKSTFVYVTHDQSEAMSLSTKLVVIKDGIIQQTGTPYEVFIRPTNKFVALVSVITVVISVLISSIAGYSYSVYNYRLLKCMFYTTIIALMVPSSALLIPTFIMFSEFKLLDRLISVCLVSLTTPLIVFLFKQSTDMFPKQLLQTARLDGLSEPKIFLKVYFPNMIPTFVTSGVLVFFEVWNGLLFPLIILQSQKNIMLPIFINSYGTSYTTNYGSFMLLLLITMLPTILLFIFTRKHFFQGLNDAL